MAEAWPAPSIRGPRVVGLAPTSPYPITSNSDKTGRRQLPPIMCRSSPAGGSAEVSAGGIEDYLPATFRSRIAFRASIVSPSG